MEKSGEATKGSIGFCFTANIASRLIQQQELHFAPPLYRADGFALVPAVGCVFTVNVPVSGFQLADKPAFRMPAMTEQHPLPHVVAQDGQEQLSKPKYYPNLTFYCIEYQ